MNLLTVEADQVNLAESDWMGVVEVDLEVEADVFAEDIVPVSHSPQQDALLPSDTFSTHQPVTHKHSHHPRYHPLCKTTNYYPPTTIYSSFDII